MAKKAMAGAGTKITELAESLQCYACSARKRKRKNLTNIDDVVRYKGTSAVAPVTLESCINGLSESWYYSCITTANQMFSDFPELDKYDYKFIHPDGALGTKIKAEFDKLKGKTSLKNINKWNPADIWVMKSSFVFKGGFKTLDEYNDYILENFQKRNLIGVSLKKIGDGEPATMTPYNLGSSSKARFTNYVVGGEVDSSKDIYIEYNVQGAQNLLEMRTFSSQLNASSWCGEIQGKNARAGKVGGSLLLQAARECGVSNSLLVTPQYVMSFINRPNDQHFEKFAKMWKVIANDRRSTKIIASIAKEAYKKDKTWFLSKYLGLAYCYAIFESNKEQAVTNWIYHYASSQTKNSSVFVKYS